jgi:uncharacterized damage-inducible protein DinB
MSSSWVSLEGTRSLVAFHHWRVARLCEVLTTLDEKTVTTPTPGSFATLGKLVAHAIGAEQIWFERIERARRGEPSASISFPTLAEGDAATLAAIWQSQALHWVSFADELTEADLAQSLHYQNLKGDTFSTPLDQILLHVLNHASYHSGQIVLIYRMLGLGGVSTDLIAFTRL